MWLFVTPWTIQSMEFSRPGYWSEYPFPSPGDLPNSGIKPQSPALQADSLPAEPQGKPKNTGVGSLSLLQRVFLTQKLNRGLLHCRRIRYQLSSQRSPDNGCGVTKVLFGVKKSSSVVVAAVVSTLFVVSCPGLFDTSCCPGWGSDSVSALTHNLGILKTH